MRARFAYISSLGTTAILVAAALLMLAVVGAIVAFRGWPGTASGESVQSVPLAPRSTASGAVKTRRVAPVRRVVRSQPARRPAQQPKRAPSAAGLVKVPDGGSSDVVPGVVLVPAPVATAPPPVTPEPISQTVPVTGSAPTPPGHAHPHPPLPGPGQVGPVPLPHPDIPGLPGTDEVETMLGGVLAATPPIPGVDVGDIHVQVPLGLGR